MQKKRGFTLIELLVVIAIIGVLSSVVLASLNSARVKARDAQRVSDLQQIRIALELYYDANGKYPTVSGWATSCDATWTPLRTALAPYMSSVPVDPVNSPGYCAGSYNTGYYSYVYGASDSFPGKYDLVAQYENKTNPLRCENHPWAWHTSGYEQSWCAVGYSPYLFEDH